MTFVEKVLTLAHSRAPAVKYAAMVNTINCKAELLQVGIFFWSIYLHDKFYSTFETDIINMGLVFLICNFFITKVSHANKWMRL